MPASVFMTLWKSTKYMTLPASWIVITSTITLHELHEAPASGLKQVYNTQSKIASTPFQKNIHTSC
jgi:hypothetical protein